MSDTFEPDAVDDIIRQWSRQWPELDVSAIHIFGRMHRSYLRYQASIAAVFDKHGINIASFDVLAALRRSGPPYQMTSGQLAEMSLVTTGGVTLRVDRLEQAGLVERERDSADRRVVYARLTAKGKAVFDAAAKEHFENENHMLAGLSAQDRKAMADLFRKLERSIVASETDSDSSESA
ncbi:MarR family transcriptional regulator [Rhodococcus erythropolis]|uniref:MarR family winged helix-turn-helix transcriptional regulator n=1 Tax=Rhodococcus erythropolis TaxID=1833 RepID=UPI00294A0A34|nr:MarR family transcriptional regulator [Rhodococcus erythropolis]MDV6275100.1 MarR family transcriptional regulator [Rhodococcus erythropolis]